ncbi:MAG: DUF362 domain-containing protein [Candidatus Aminicenantes bacterium]|nr:DUF362 domain-containing protein [Candidatus Aminicenantes bacterium]
MKQSKSPVTRRDFLRGTAGAALGLALLGPEGLKASGRTQGRSTVILVRDREVMDASLRVNKKILTDMLDQVLTGVTGESGPSEAWKKLVRPDDIIGLAPTPFMNPTHDELMDAVKESLVRAGIPAANIRNAQGRSVDLAPLTALICMPGLKAHWLTGVGTVIKNYIMYSGAPRNYHYQDSAKLGEIWNLLHVKGKTRLILVDALHPVCDKGPQVDPRYRWAYNGLIAGTDPVAVETVGLKIIQAKRDALRGEPWPLSPPPICIEAADRVYHLGTSDPGKIDIRKVGWTEDALV